MIVDMKKITILCLASGRDQSLNALRDLGVLHVSHVQALAGNDLDEACDYLKYARRALEVLPHHPHVKESGQTAHEVVESVWKLIHIERDLSEKLQSLMHEKVRLEPYGSFDPDSIRRLAEQGITVKLYHSGPGQDVDIPEDAVMALLSRDRQGSYFAVIGRGELNIDADEAGLPECSLREIERGIAETEEALEKSKAEFETHAGDYPAVADIVEDAEEKVRYFETRAGMGTTDPVDYLKGYCPIDMLDRVRGAAAENGWGLIVDDPAGGERVPTLIRTPRWARPIKAVFDMIGILPGYDEIDVSGVFLLFFSLFYGMLVGDAGYGLLFMICTLWARKKFPNMPRQLFSLLIITSICTIGWGVITGAYFGIANLPAPLRGLKIEWLSSDAHLMGLCFLIGAIHLTVAHAWKALVLLPKLRAIAELGWICSTWAMYFVARLMVLGHEFPSFVVPVLAVGIAAIVLFMTPVKELKHEIFKHFMLPLDLIGNFVDIVSYVRLFAVGLATLAVARAFNEMAVGDGITSVPGALVAAFVLFAGHTLNIAMAIMGVLVHGLRLNALEFSQHIGITWKGFAYNPFARRKFGEAGVVGQAG